MAKGFENLVNAETVREAITKAQSLPVVIRYTGTEKINPLPIRVPANGIDLKLLEIYLRLRILDLDNNDPLFYISYRCVDLNGELCWLLNFNKGEFEL